MRIKKILTKKKNESRVRIKKKHNLHDILIIYCQLYPIVFLRLNYWTFIICGIL